MPLIVSCTGCEKTLKVPDEFAGRKIRCPSCKEIVSVPALEGETGIQKERPIPLESHVQDPPARAPREEHETDDEDGPPRRRWDEDDIDDRNNIDVRQALRTGNRDYAYGRLMGPAIGLMAVSGLHLALAILGLFFFLGVAAINPQVAGPDDLVAQMIGNVASSIIAIALQGTIFLGAFNMLKLWSYPFSMVITILSLIPLCCSSCYVFGMPFAIWALIGLLDDRVRLAFAS